MSHADGASLVCPPECGAGLVTRILAIQIESRVHERQGKAVTNFAATLPPARSDLAAQVFKDPYLFDFLGTADPRREREVELSWAR